MSTSAQRKAVFEDTQKWIESDPDLSAPIPIAKKNTIAHLKQFRREIRSGSSRS